MDTDQIVSAILKCLDTLFQLAILGLLIYCLFDSPYGYSKQDFEDYSAVYFLGIGFYQLLSFNIHLFVFKNEARLRIGRIIYFILIPLFFLAYYIYLQQPHYVDLDSEFIYALHIIAFYYLAICITETISLFILKNKSAANS